ncbi:hypothetical protein B6U99_04415 [Candidatus Geothermarchaeota archaeon ex4572_27]|nr:MAG: hypothetical protein B6U99_04415 [Candidatus Geothermarchaeota archaeon ex4572_27]
MPPRVEDAHQGVLRLEFTSGGYRLVGNLHLPRRGAPCVLLLHGLDSHKDGGKWPRLAERLCQAGFAAFRFNFRGCGIGPEASEGRFEETTLSGRLEDLRAAVDLLRRSGLVDASRLGAVGSSFGGMVALAGSTLFKAMVLLATPCRMHVPAGGLTLPSGKRIGPSLAEDLRRYDMLRLAAEAPPLLIIHGSRDEVVPPEHATALYRAARQPKRLEIVEGADHVFSRPEHLERVVSLCIEWLRRYLGGGSP